MQLQRRERIQGRCLSSSRSETMLFYCISIESALRLCAIPTGTVLVLDVNVVLFLTSKSWASLGSESSSVVTLRNSSNERLV